jgi:hypothetical protein
MALLLGLIKTAALFILIIALAGFIGKLSGKFFDNDPR